MDLLWVVDQHAHERIAMTVIDPAASEDAYFLPR